MWVRVQGLPDYVNKIFEDKELPKNSSATERNQGGENPVFGKPWFCLRDTRHFRHFRRSPGSEERNPLFLWVECKSSFSPFFVKTTCFRWGDKNTIFQKHRFHNPDESISLLGVQGVSF